MFDCPLSFHTAKLPFFTTILLELHGSALFKIRCNLYSCSMDWIVSFIRICDS